MWITSTQPTNQPTNQPITVKEQYRGNFVWVQYPPVINNNSNKGVVKTKRTSISLSCHVPNERKNSEMLKVVENVL
jgi:hypothetical protein